MSEPRSLLHLQRDDAQAAADDDLVVGDPVGRERVVPAVDERDAGASAVRVHVVLEELRGGRRTELAQLHLRPGVRVEEAIHGRLDLRGPFVGPRLSKSVPP